MKVYLFARCREIVGQADIYLSVSKPVTADEFRGELLKLYPALRELLAKCFIAVDNEYITPQQLIDPNDVVALIPPVSGG